MIIPMVAYETLLSKAGCRVARYANIRSLCRILISSAYYVEIMTLQLDLLKGYPSRVLEAHCQNFLAKCFLLITTNFNGGSISLGVLLGGRC